MRINLYNFPAASVPALQRTAAKALKAMPAITKGSICIILLSKYEMLKLNKKYLNSSRNTDVISFTYSSNALSGDIFISESQSKLQAESEGHSWIDELKYLVIHGVLHLLGYADYTKKEKKNMFKIQDKIFLRC
jgi:probable rRNA maturation factor